MIKKIVFLILFVGMISFGAFLSPFGLYNNYGLILEQPFVFLGLNTSDVLLLKQDIYSVDDLNNLLNEGVLNLSNIKELSAYSVFNASFYGTLKIGSFSLTPFVNLDGYIDVNLPEEIRNFIVNDIKIDESYEVNSESFFDSSIFLNAGLVLNIGKIFVAPSVYLPVLYTDKENQSLLFEYTSTSSPAEADLKFQASSLIYSYLSLDDLNYSIEELLNVPQNMVDDLGIALSVGYHTNNLGIAINNIMIKPSISKYKASLTADASLLYTGDGTDISMSYDATYLISDLESCTKEISKLPEISAYLKTNGPLALGVRGKYSFDGNWAVGGFVSAKILFFSPHYSLDYLSAKNMFIHSMGSNINLRIIYLGFNVKLISDTVSPFDANSIGVNFNFGFGI